MKKGTMLTISNARVGQKVKVAIVRSWAQTPYQKPYSKGHFCWVKGKISSIHNSSITINTRYKYHKRCIRSFLQNLFTVANKKGEFEGIYLQLK